MRAPVVVGVGGTSSHEALLWAARAARRRARPLHVVHAYWTALVGYEVSFDQALEQQEKEHLAAQAEMVERWEPGLEITTELVMDTPAHALTQRSQDADLLVVGTRHRSVVERLLSGSRSYQIAAGSHCPVVVVPSTAASTAAGGDVVVGVDGSADSLAAVAFAAAEADRLGVHLHVVHAWQEPAGVLPSALVDARVTAHAEQVEALVLAESCAGLSEQYPDLHVGQELVHDRPATALVRWAEAAQLLVVGSRGRNGVARMLLGSVSHAVVLQPPCSVAVVRT